MVMFVDAPQVLLSVNTADRGRGNLDYLLLKRENHSSGSRLYFHKIP